MPPGQRRRLYSAAVLLSLTVAGSVRASPWELISVSSNGTPDATYSSSRPSISCDGRYVTFSTRGASLVSGDTNSVVDVFVRDRALATTERASVSSAGNQGNGQSWVCPNTLGISDDGRYVTFYSEASNLVANDTNGVKDIFVRDRLLQTTERVSVNSSEEQANGESSCSSITRDGRFVIFDSAADNLSAGTTPGRRHVYVRDRLAGTTSLLVTASGGSEPDSSVLLRSGATHERFFLVDSGATNISAKEGETDNYLVDLFGGSLDGLWTLTLSNDVVPVQGRSATEDGRLVAFAHTDSLGTRRLYPGDANNAKDIFVLDRETGTVSHENVSTAGQSTPYFHQSGGETISRDGRYVSFYSWAYNLVPDDSNGEYDVFVRDRHRSETISVSLTGDGGGGSANAAAPLSCDGRFVAFVAAVGAQLVPEDTNNAQDVYVYDRAIGSSGVVEPPIAEFFWEPVAPLLGQAVRFRDASTGFPSDHAWDFDDDSEPDSLLTNPTHIFDTAGTFWVELEACNEAGCDTHGEWITVGNSSITVSGPTVGGVLDELAFSSSAEGCSPDPTGWNWLADPDSLVIPSGNTATIGWTIAGEKEVEVTNSACGAVSGVATVEVSGQGDPWIQTPGDYELYCWPGDLCEASDLDPGKGTLVLVHGLQGEGFEPHELWTRFESPWGGGFLALADLVLDMQQDVNLVQFVWHPARQNTGLSPTKSSYIRAWSYYVDAGHQLAMELNEALGGGYAQPVHFVGHSLGTAVAAVAAWEFLHRAPAIGAAQYTALDRPHHIDKIPSGLSVPWTNEELEQYGFDEQFLGATLPFGQIPGLDLRADNYYSGGFTGVGDWAEGSRVYNHGFLSNPGYLELIFKESPPPANNHSGVHQWYRWTMEPVDTSFQTVCDEIPFRDPTNEHLGDSLNPCGTGWAWSFLRNGGFGAFPPFNGNSARSFSSDLTQANSTDAGCGVWNGSYLCTPPPQAALSTDALGLPPRSHSSSDIQVPDNAAYVTFDFEFSNSEGGDAYAAVFVDDVAIWTLRGSIVEQGVTLTTPPLGVAGLLGQRKLSVALFSEGDPDVTIEFTNFRFLTQIPTEQVDAGLVVQDATEVDTFPSQEYEQASSAFDAIAVDDFTVPAETDHWYIGQVEAHGAYENGSGPAPLVNVEILDDNAGFPGAALCSHSGLVAGTDYYDVNGRLSILLPDVCSLTPGDYWVTVQADMDSTDGDWVWGTSLPVTGQPALWQNPGDGWGTGCTTWSDAGTCFGLGGSRDLAFTLLGPASCTYGVSDLVLEDMTVSSSQDFLACRTIGADSVQISGTSTDVTLRAGNKISLGNGFSVESGSSLSIAIGPPVP